MFGILAGGLAILLKHYPSTPIINQVERVFFDSDDLKIFPTPFHDNIYCFQAIANILVFFKASLLCYIYLPTLWLVRDLAFRGLPLITHTFFHLNLEEERVYMQKPFHSDRLRGWTKGRFFQRFSVLTVSKGSIWIAMDRKWLVPRGRVGSLEEETTAA